ncbi:hypothetical protein P43SY_009837 [Pythium insidiosum]|uniref:Protein kinase domain-containing protein n=1 Tax=Pythium insidiosum TaxID=114742 RepID=A0AAD5LA70_PYTIN|nr:hypothetical protein P43SY_009837 [Pythium insidiosum]
MASSTTPTACGSAGPATRLLTTDCGSDCGPYTLCIRSGPACEATSCLTPSNASAPTVWTVAVAESPPTAMDVGAAAQARAIGVTAIAPLAPPPTVKALVLLGDGTRLSTTSTDARAFVRGLGNLLALEIRRLHLSLPLYPALARLPALQRLVLDDAAPCDVTANATGSEVAAAASTQVDATLKAMAALRQLSLRQAGLTAIPSAIQGLHQLVELALSNCSFGSIPRDLVNIQSLQRLTIVESPLETLPPDLLKASALRRLDLSHNALSTFDTKHVNHSTLAELYLQSNRFLSIPRAVFSLPALRTLRLDDNPIRPLVVSWDEISFLQRLDVFIVDKAAAWNPENISDERCDVVYGDGQRRLLHGVSVCVTESGSKDTNPTTSTPRPPPLPPSVYETFLVIANVVLALLLLAAIIVVVVAMRRRHLSLRKMLAPSPTSSATDSAALGQRVTESMRRFLGLHDDDEKDIATRAKAPSRDLIEGTLMSTQWQHELARFRVDSTAVVKSKLLASGQFGHVWWATLQPSGLAVAVKSLRDPRRVSNDVVERFVREALLLAALEHPRIVPLLGVAWTSPVDLAIVLQLAERGDLLSLLAAVRPSRQETVEETKEETTESDASAADDRLPFQLRIRVALEIAEALVYLHSLSPAVLHRDLKSGNVLLDAEWHVLVADFGCARCLPEDDASDKSSSQSSRMTESVGTVRWLAPEVLAGEPYDTSVDVFALGQILSELLTDRVPYHAMRSASDRAIPDHVLATLLVSGELSPPVVEADDVAELSTIVEEDGEHDNVSETTATRRRATVSRGRRALGVLMTRCTAREPATRPSAVQIAFELRKLLVEMEGVEDVQLRALENECHGKRAGNHADEDEEVAVRAQAALSTESSVALLSSSRSLSPSATIEAVDDIALREELEINIDEKEEAKQ